MEAPVELEITLGRPAVAAGEEPEQPAYARVRLRPRAEAAGRPRLNLGFVIDASASMHRFVLDPEQRAYWRQRAEQRGEISRQEADGRTGMVWRGETLRELQKHVSTPMLSCARGVWRTLEALQPSDGVGLVAFADQAAVLYEDMGVPIPAQRLEQAKAALTRLGSGVDESGLGRGTRLAGALQHVLQARATALDAPSIRRLVLVSDGIIEDEEACRPLLEAAADGGYVISVIGVGDEFDEEFLMQTADMTRGNYYYAPTAPEVEQAMRTELEITTQVVARQAFLRVWPENGAVLRDVYPIAPALSEFRTVWVENGTWKFRAGDLSLAQPTEFLVEIAPAGHEEGQIRVASARIEGLAASSDGGFAAQAGIPLVYSDDAMLLQARDDEVLDAVRRVEIYQEERRAAEAMSRGDSEGSTRHLRAATKMLRSRGDAELADEMDAAADDAESGTRNLGRTKRVKAGTRRLTARPGQ